MIPRPPPSDPEDLDASSSPRPSFSRRRCLALLQSSTSIPNLKQIHARALRAGVPVSSPDLGKHLIFAIASLPSPLLSYADTIFGRISRPSIFTFNTMIRLHAESPSPSPALPLLPRLLSAGLSPDSHTYPFLLKACAKLLLPRHGELVHARSVRDGHNSVFVLNSLLHLYSACGQFHSAHKLFEEIPHRNLISWNTIINGFALNGRPNEALTLFREMSHRRVAPDGFTMVSLLSACGELGALVLARRLHVYLSKLGLYQNSHVGNALIDLYAKTGAIIDAEKVFHEMGSRKTRVSWTTLIVGMAVNGFGEEALKLFKAMEIAGETPTEITFVGVLYACSHCGLVEEGFEYFERMKEEFKIEPKIEHMGCMVDLLGRAGQVDRAYKFILDMPIEANAVVWRTLLGACAMQRRVDLGEAAWARLERLEPGHSGDYVLLSNLYAGQRRWADVGRIRGSMLRKGVKKTPGKTLVEIGNSVWEFVMGDRSHPESEEIYAMVEEVAGRLRKEGYTAGTTAVLADIEDEEKETALRYHSERLAIAYALMKTAPGVTIRLVKNLRVCEDCHTVTKLISRVYAREIVVRDRSRFHHFSGGRCSCRDYW
ncbi:tetratricopeptide repeat (TPR)-like superfamily protein [Wolffia australiana]